MSAAVELELIVANSRDGDRVARERDFHNDLYSSDSGRSEQAKYYWAVGDGLADYERIREDFARGKDVLEYGCGDTRNFAKLAPVVRSFHAVDISDAVIEQMKSESTYDNVSLHVMDAMALTFADNSFDLVFGGGIIHHLETEDAVREVARVLRPGGRALFWEPLGLNPVINLYRRWTPQARSVDEHPLVPRDFAAIADHLEVLDVRYYGLTTIAAVPLRHRKIGQAALALSRRVDKALLALPGVRHLAWYALITGTVR